MNIKYLDENTLELCLFEINEKDVKEALMRQDAFKHVDSRHFVGAKSAYQAAEENASGMHGSFWLPNGKARFHDVEDLRQWIIQILNVFGYEDMRTSLRFSKTRLIPNTVETSRPC